MITKIIILSYWKFEMITKIITLSYWKLNPDKSTFNIDTLRWLYSYNLSQSDFSD